MTAFTLAGKYHWFSAIH